MNKQEQLNELARLTNSIEPTPHIIGLTKIYMHYLPYLRLLELPVPSPEFMFQIFTVKEIETLLTTLHTVFANLQMDDLIVFVPYGVLLVKDALELAAFSGRYTFENFIRNFIASDMQYQTGGSKKYRNLFDTVIGPLDDKIMRGGELDAAAMEAMNAKSNDLLIAQLRELQKGPPTAKEELEQYLTHLGSNPEKHERLTIIKRALGIANGPSSAAAPAAPQPNARPSAALANRSARVPFSSVSGILSTKTTETAELAAARTGLSQLLGPAVSSAVMSLNSLEVKKENILAVKNIFAERKARLSKYLASTAVITEGLQKLKNQLQGNDLELLRKKFEQTAKQIMNHAQKRFVSQSTGNSKRSQMLFSFDEAKVDLEKFKEKSAEEFGIGLNKNGAVLMSCALGVVGGCAMGYREFEYLFNTRTTGTYPENIRFTFDAQGQKLRLKANATAMWDPDTVVARPKLSPEELQKASAKVAAAYKQLGQEVPKIEKPVEPKQKTIMVDKCGRAAGNMLPAWSCGTTLVVPSEQELQDYSFRLEQWKRANGVAETGSAFIDFGNVVTLGVNGSAPMLLNDPSEFEPGECELGYRFDTKQFKCLMNPAPSNYTIWNDQAQRWDPRLVLADGTNCLAPSTYFSVSSLTATAAAVGTTAQFTRNPATLLAIGAGSYVLSAGTMTSGASCMAPLGAALWGGGGTVIAGLSALGGLCVLCPLIAGGGLAIGGRFLAAKLKRQSNLNKGEQDIKMIVDKINNSWDSIISVQLKNSLLTRLSALINFTGDYETESAFAFASGSILQSNIVTKIDEYLQKNDTGKSVPNNLKGRLIDEGIIQTTINNWADETKETLKKLAGEKNVQIDDDPFLMLSFYIIDKLRTDRQIYVALNLLNDLVPDPLNKTNENKTFNILPKNIFKNFNLGKLNVAAATQAVSKNELVVNGTVDTSAENIRATLEATKRALAAAQAAAANAQAAAANAQRQRNAARVAAAPVVPSAPAAPARVAPAAPSAARANNTAGGQIRNRETRRGGGKKRKVNRKTRRSRR